MAEILEEKSLSFPTACVSCARLNVREIKSFAMIMRSKLVTSRFHTSKERALNEPKRLSQLILETLPRGKNVRSKGSKALFVLSRRRCARSHDRVTSRVGMKDLCRSREGSGFRFSRAARRSVPGARGRSYASRLREATSLAGRSGRSARSRRRFEFITLTLTPRTVWMASSTRAKFPLPMGFSI